MFDDILKSMKSGGSSSYGASRVPNIPDGYSEDALRWSQISRTLNEGLADAWFEAYNPVPILESVPPEAALDPKKYFDLFASFLFEEDRMKVVPSFKKEFSDFGEIQKLDNSPLGQALIASLEKLGVSWYYETTYPVDEKTVVELLDLHEEGIAQWGTYFGMPVQQRFRVYKNSQGVETIVWFSNVLAATREFEHIRTRTFEMDDTVYVSEIEEEEVQNGALTFGQWSTEFFIPSLAKKLFYLAETDFPSNIMAFPRSSAYRDLDETKFPHPFVVNERRASAQGSYDSNLGSLLASSTIFPNVISMGWAFSASDHESISIILTRITDALVKINSYLEDGYLNFNDPDEPYQFDRVVLSASTFDVASDQQRSAMGLSRWIPVVRVGFLLNETNVRGSAVFEGPSAREDQHLRAEFAWLSNDGAGAFVSNAINSYVYVWLLPDNRWDEVDRLLDAAVRLEVKNQSTNALSNWGISYHLRGDDNKAIELFEKALSREDGYAEAEASFFLALIWDSRGDTSRADSFRTRCEAAGGYSLPAFMSGEVTAPSSGLTKSNPQDKLAAPSSGLTKSNAQDKPTASFCTNCGSQFARATARFCAECGTAR
jgi:tetratricopeptide (TPR) repeat protein